MIVMKRRQYAISTAAFFLLLATYACSSSNDSAGPTTNPPPAGGDDGGNGLGEGGGAGGDAGDEGGALVTGKNADCPLTTKTRVDVPTGVLPADTTWTKGNVYLVQGFVSTGAHKLTIEAGTFVCFREVSDLQSNKLDVEIDDDGELDVLGTAAEPVVFTVEPSTADAWAGISYTQQSKPSTIQNAEFYYAGNSGAGTLINAPAKPDGPKLDWRNVQVFEYQRNALEIGLGGFTPESSITVHYAQKIGARAQLSETPDYYFNYPVAKVRPENLATITATTIVVDPASPAPTKYIEVDSTSGAKYDQSYTLHKSDLTYVFRQMHVDGVASAPAKLTLEAGVHVAITEDGSLSVGEDGYANLVAVGTAADPILFTSAAPFEKGAAPMPGDWTTINFAYGGYDPAISKIDYAHFEYGGRAGTLSYFGCDGGATGGYIGFQSSPAQSDPFPGFPITNSIFEKSAGMAIRESHNPPKLSTNYQDASFHNQFLGFTTPAAQYFGACP
jgi:hypothetical protein